MKTKPTTNEPPPTSTTFAADRQGQVITHFCVLTLSTTAAVEKCHEQQQKKTHEMFPSGKPLRREEVPPKKGKNQKIDSAPRSFLFCKSFSRSPRKGPILCVSWVGLLWKGRRRCATHFLDDFWPHLVTSDGCRFVVGWSEKKREDLLE